MCKTLGVRTKTKQGWCFIDVMRSTTAISFSAIGYQQNAES